MKRYISALSLAAATVALTGCGWFQSADPTPQRAQVTLRIADAALASGAPDLALRVADLVLQKQPDNIEALVAKGDALYALGAVEQARTAYRMAVMADAGNVAAQIGLGRTLVRSDAHSAETHFLAAVGKDPGNVIALNNLGIARDMQGHHAEAQEAYRQALELVPEMPDVKTNLGLSLALSGQASQAVAMLRPVATTSDATTLKRADLAVAMAQAHDVGSSGPVKAQDAQAATARFDLPPLAIEPAPVAAVERAPLAAVAVAEPAVAKLPRPANATSTDTNVSGVCVQLASLDSEQAAGSVWQKLRVRWPDLLAAREPTVTAADINDHKYWRLRTGGFSSMNEASAFCARLHAVGAGCWTVAGGTPKG